MALVLKAGSVIKPEVTEVTDTGRGQSFVGEDGSGYRQPDRLGPVTQGEVHALAGCLSPHIAVELGHCAQVLATCEKTIPLFENSLVRVCVCV